MLEPPAQGPGRPVGQVPQRRAAWQEPEPGPLAGEWLVAQPPEEEPEPGLAEVPEPEFPLPEKVPPAQPGFQPQAPEWREQPVPVPEPQAGWGQQERRPAEAWREPDPGQAEEPARVGPPEWREAVREGPEAAAEGPRHPGRWDHPPSGQGY